MLYQPNSSIHLPGAQLSFQKTLAVPLKARHFNKDWQ
jgi:hypothetical protein